MSDIDYDAIEEAAAKEAEGYKYGKVSEDEATVNLLPTPSQEELLVAQKQAMKTGLKYLIIYHAHCNDGFGAAWVIHKHVSQFAEPDEVILHEAAYGSKVPYDLITDNTAVFIVDFSYAPDVLTDLCAVAAKVIWIDHHKTALDAWAASGVLGGFPDNLTTSLSTEHSGAMLCWNYINHSAECPVLIKYIQDRDLWEFKLEDTKAFHLNLSTLPKDMEYWSALANYLESPLNLERFLVEGRAIERYYTKVIEGIIATNKVQCYIDGILGLAVNCPGAFASDIGHILATESGTFGLTWEEQKGGIEKCSLRSNDDFDVSVMAKSFGGGGHKNAAGFVINLVDSGKGRIRFKPL